MTQLIQSRILADRKQIKGQVKDLPKKQVCDGTITLKEAQDQMTGDWYKIYLAHF